MQTENSVSSEKKNDEITGGWKLVRLPDRLPMLYDLLSDVSEQNNVVLQNIDKTKELLKN